MAVSNSQIDLIEASFEQVKRHKQAFSAAFYERLFSQHPQLQPLFSATSSGKQGSKLYAALVLLVENLRHPVELERVLLPLGEKHIGYGATAENFPMFGGAILWTLEEFLDENWTQELNEAWTETLEMVTLTMLRGAGMSRTPGVQRSMTGQMSKQAIPAAPAADEETIKRVESSFSSVKADRDEFTATFYRKLFQDSPQLQPLFAGVDMQRQGSKLYAALELLVLNLRQPGELDRVLMPLGKKHVTYGATREHYPLVCSAIEQTLGEFLADEWTPDVSEAWRQTFLLVQETMLRGAEGATPMRAAVSIAAPSDVPAGPADDPTQGTAVAGEVRREGLLERFATSFYSARLSTIIGVWAVIGVTLVSLSFVFPSIRSVVVFANPLSLLLALFLYIRETPERKKQFHYHAWSTIDNAAHVKTSNARFLALQDLCADGVSLKGLPLDGADLIGIDLKGADLASASMQASNLTAANLVTADLNNVNLQRAILSGAHLAGANLGFAKMAGANCSSADLSGANLMFADLANANLSGTNLTGAKLSGASFEGTYLSGANLQGSDVRADELEGAFLVGAVLPDGTIAS